MNIVRIFIIFCLFFILVPGLIIPIKLDNYYIQVIIHSLIFSLIFIMISKWIKNNNIEHYITTLCEDKSKIECCNGINDIGKKIRCCTDLDAVKYNTDDPETYKKRDEALTNSCLDTVDTNKLDNIYKACEYTGSNSDRDLCIKFFNKKKNNIITRDIETSNIDSTKTNDEKYKLCLSKSNGTDDIDFNTCLKDNLPQDYIISKRTKDCNTSKNVNCCNAIDDNEAYNTCCKVLNNDSINTCINNRNISINTTTSDINKTKTNKIIEPKKQIVITRDIEIPNIDSSSINSSGINSSGINSSNIDLKQINDVKYKLCLSKSNGNDDIEFNKCLKDNLSQDYIIEQRTKDCKSSNNVNCCNAIDNINAYKKCCEVLNNNSIDQCINKDNSAIKNYDFNKDNYISNKDLDNYSREPSDNIHSCLHNSDNKCCNYLKDNINNRIRCCTDLDATNKEYDDILTYSCFDKIPITHTYIDTENKIKDKCKNTGSKDDYRLCFNYFKDLKDNTLNDEQIKTIISDCCDNYVCIKNKIAESRPLLHSKDIPKLYSNVSISDINKLKTICNNIDGHKMNCAYNINPKLDNITRNKLIDDMLNDISNKFDSNICNNINSNANTIDCYNRMSSKVSDIKKQDIFYNITKSRNDNQLCNDKSSSQCCINFDYSKYKDINKKDKKQFYKNIERQRDEEIKCCDKLKKDKNVEDDESDKCFRNIQFKITKNKRGSHRKTVNIKML